MSAVALGKTCRKLQVPLPGRGYWAKKAHGCALECKALPKVHDVPRIVRHERVLPKNVPPSPPTRPEFPVEKKTSARLLLSISYSQVALLW